MNSIQIRKCRKSDKDEIINVCFHCGYYGGDASPYFSDKNLFGLLFCSYYPKYEPENGFVAVTQENNKRKIIGYALSSLDTKKYEKIYKQKIKWKLILRLYIYTSWRYHSDFHIVRRFLKNSKPETGETINEIAYWEEYPAHLHIDVLNQYQRKGIGTRLIKSLEDHLISKGVKGVCLGTSEKNYKSIPFYKKHNYRLLGKSQGLGFWPEDKEIQSLYFGKRLC
ncbi:MAG: GNAT family N-acetyltransferase [Promethearchaeia archaeon]